MFDWISRRYSTPHPGSFVLVSGATGGLGKAFAVECADRGWNLFLTDLNVEALEALSESLQCTYGVRILSRACDLTYPEERTALFQYIADKRLRFWSLINVAGLDYEGPFFEQTRQKIRTIIRLNVEATLDMILGLMAYRDPLTTFRIINVSSLAAFYPMPIKATYAASKRFLLDFSLALGEEVQELDATVTALCPAGMPTTPETIASIDRQGLMGQLTTMNTGTVAHMTLDYALRGKSVCIPGSLNRLLQIAGALAPTSLVVGLIGSRWKAAFGKRTQVLPAEANL